MDATVNSKLAADATAWHAITVDQVLKRLTTSTDKGLDAGEAAARLQKYGPNRLPEGKKRGPFMRFISQFNNILVYVLLGAGFTKLMLNLWVDAGIIFGVVILGAEASLEQIRPRAALVRQLDGEEGAKLLRYRKAVTRLGVKNVDHVLGIVVESAEGEFAVSEETSGHTNSALRIHT